MHDSGLTYNSSLSFMKGDLKCHNLMSLEATEWKFIGWDKHRDGYWNMLYSSHIHIYTVMNSQGKEQHTLPGSLDL